VLRRVAEDNVRMPDERASWNQRYRERSPSSLEPDPLLVTSYEEFIQPLFPHGGIALDVAGGVGRHGRWLAERNWKVDPRLELRGPSRTPGDRRPIFDSGWRI